MADAEIVVEHDRGIEVPVLGVFFGESYSDPGGCEGTTHARGPLESARYCCIFFVDSRQKLIVVVRYLLNEISNVLSVIETIANQRHLREHDQVDLLALKFVEE